MKKLLSPLAILVLTCGTTFGAHDWGLQPGTPVLKSASVLAFGPDDILFVGDTKSASVIAIATGDTQAVAARAPINLANVQASVSDVVGGNVAIQDIAANPRTGTVFVACSVAGGDPVIVQIDGAGRISQLDLEGIHYAQAVLNDAPEDKETGKGRRRRNNRADAITDLAYFEGKLLVSGLRAAGSSVREFEFPFAKNSRGVGIQIYHAAHGRDEDYSAMRTFIPMMIDGEPNLLGAYVCTPLVKIPLSDIASGGDRVTATTVAELGNRNKPLDMVSYTKDDNAYLLLSNSDRGVMKITTAGLYENEGLSDRVAGGGTAGQTFETIDDLEGVVQMAKINERQIVVLIDNNGQLDLKTVALP